MKVKYPPAEKKYKRLETQVQRYFAQNKNVTIANNADFLLEVKFIDGKDVVQLVDRNQKTIWTANLIKRDSLLDSEKQTLLNKIKQETRVKYLRTLPDGGILSASVKANIVDESNNNAATGIELSYGEKYGLKIENNSDTDLYYTVLDIYPDNKVEILYPYKGKEPADYFIKSKSAITRKLAVSQGSPKGVETLKIIVSKQPMDLRAVFENKMTRGDMVSFQAVMDDVMNDRSGNATRAEVANVKVEEIGILSASFIVK